MNRLYTQEAVQAWLTAKLAEYLSIDPAGLDVYEPFASYGLESADAVSLSGELEEWLGRELSPTLVYDYPSVDALARYLAGAPESLERQALTAPAVEACRESVAIIGIGCRFPGGASSPDAFWQLLRGGVDATSEVPADRWDVDAFYDPDPDAPGKMYARRGGFLDGIGTFDAEFFGISPREAVRMEPQQRLLLEVAWEALEHAGVSTSMLAGSQTGVFVGLMNTHEYAQLQANLGDASYVDDPYFGIGSASSIASGRLSYLFDLQGPNITVDTACSSSLVATHLACQSLRSGECNLALIAGVNAITLPESMVNACKMRMLARDGRCKTFDAAADGFVLGEGCGVVVLKRLSDALADGDTILAQIRGSAVNQDGRSNGITAPNRLAQQAVIRSALAQAGVEPHQVGYVEAHGSGTALGDPIEVAALGAVLAEGRSKEHRLAVGTVKTNIGHLAGAAGIAGLIKTVLTLQHKEIPPHLHLREPNPNVDWDSLPVVVPTTPAPWATIDGPRIAGVSSFGWSGTNAHVVLEEAPPAAAAGESRPWQLLALSAKTESGLETATRNLLAHLKEHPGENLADVAYTLQCGRTALGHRRIVICRDRVDAIAALESHDPEGILTGGHKGAARPVAFMFPGVGDQYANMARELYTSEPIFRDELDRCCELLRPHLGLDLRDVLYPASTAGAAPAEGLDLRRMLGRSREQADGSTGALTQTALAQPLLFAVEYSLARLWLAWGVRPEAMIGYSLGEYVAACLAGVLTLDDALALVAARARMIEELPVGSMLAVALPERDVQPLLGPKLSLSAANGSNLCILGGVPEAIDELQEQLARGGTACRRLQTSHAFHSTMMEPIVERFTELVASITLNPPAIPYVSNVTGTWITAEQATDPGYWALHLRRTVRFADGLRELWRKPGTVLLEVGPGQSLGSFALQEAIAAGATGAVVLASLRSAYDRRSDLGLLLATLGKLWLAGVPIAWDGFWAEERRRRLPLPTYPFERQRYWVETTARSRAGSPQRRHGAKTPDVADWFYVPTWKQSRPLLRSDIAEPAAQQHSCLVFADRCDVGSRLGERLEGRGDDVTLVYTGDSFRRVRNGVYTIDPRSREDYSALLKHLQLVGKSPQKIVHLWSVTHGEPAGVDASSLEASHYLGFYSLLFLAQALGSHHPGRPLQLLAVSNGLHDVIGDEDLRPEKATILGPCKVIPKEYSGMTCRSVDVVVPAAGTREAEALVDRLVFELGVTSADSVVAFRGSRRWVQSFEPLRIEQTSDTAAGLRERGVYLITGGLGGLGLALADYLATAVHAQLVLIGRSDLPAREQWGTWLEEHGEQEQVSRKLRAILALEAAGADVLAVSADVSDAEQMQAAIETAHARFGRIHGVFHAAGVPGEGLIQIKTPEIAERVLAPKVGGTLVLDAVLRHEELDFMVLYSSSNAVTGGLGEVDYCAANAFLDAFAHYSSARRSTPTIAIDWGPWQWDAWQSTRFESLPELQAEIQRIRGAYGITFAEGAEALSRILSNPLPQVLVLTQELQATIEQWDGLTAAGLLTTIDEGRRAGPAHPRPNLRNPYVAPRDEAEQKIAAIWQELLGIERVGIHDQFFELGGNSLIGMLIISRLEKEFGAKLSAASLFEGPTISSLLQLIRPEGHAAPVLEGNSTRGKLRRERLRKQQHSLQKQEERW